MAITSYSVRDTKVGIQIQSAWGTAIADNAAMLELDCESFVVERDLKKIEGLGSHGTRVLDTEDVRYNNYEARPKCTIKGLALNDTLSFFLYGFFQSVTEEVATPFKKTFVLHATQPDFSINAGAYFTIVNRAPNASVSHKIIDCVIESLELSIEPGGQLMYSASFVGRGGVITTSNPSGTWTRLAKTTIGVPNYWPYATQVRHTIGGTAAVLTGGWTLSLTQDVLPVGQNGTGDIQTIALVNKRGKFTSKILWDALTATSAASLVSGTTTTIVIGWGSATAGTVNRDLDLTFQGKFTKVDRDNAEVFGADIELELLGTISVPTQAITVIHADAVDRTW